MQFDADQARQAWRALGYAPDLTSLQTKIVNEAFKRRRVIDPRVPDLADIALGWAWAVLGPPQARRRHRWYEYVWTNVICASAMGRGITYMNHISGFPEDDRIIGVRRAARKVEAVYASHATRSS